MYSKMAMLDSRWRGGTLPSTYFRQILTKNATKKSTKKLQNGNTWLDSGREGKSSKFSLLACFEKKSHPKSPPKFKMAKWTPKWQHLAQFREGGEIYQILTFGMIWKKSQSKAHIFFKMVKILHTGNTWPKSGGEGGNLPNTHLWRILKKSHPKMAPKWQRRIGNANSFTAHRICWSYYQKFVEVVVHNHLCFAS